MSRQSRGEKGENKVINVLQKQNIYHRLINNLTLEGNSGITHQIDHIFICENGVFVIESKSLYGQISGDIKDTVWLKIVKNKKINIHNPLLQNKSHVRIVKQLLGPGIDVISIVVFTLNNAPYFPNDNVINLDQLNVFIKEYPYKRKYNPQQIEQIADYLLKKESDLSLEKHLENIAKIKDKRNKHHQDISYAIENRKCPRCGSSIREKNGCFMCSKCDFTFHL